MHEYAVTQSLLDTALEYARKNKAKRVLSLNLVIGDLSGIIDESVQFYWDMVSEDSICSSAKLNFGHVKAKMACGECGNEFLMGEELSPCPECGSMALNIIAGKEFRLESIEIEK